MEVQRTKRMEVQSEPISLAIAFTAWVQSEPWGLLCCCFSKFVVFVALLFLFLLLLGCWVASFFRCFIV